MADYRSLLRPLRVCVSTGLKVGGGWWWWWSEEDGLTPMLAQSLFLSSSQVERCALSAGAPLKRLAVGGKGKKGGRKRKWWNDQS